MARTIKNLWNQIASYDALLVAWKEVRKRKTSNPVVLEYESNLSVNLSRLEKKLLSGEYKPQPHYEFWIYDPKARLIQAPRLEDRIVQHAVCNAIREPITKRFIDQTYSCIIGRGTHKCSNQLSKYLKNPKYQYALKLDISKFFYSIDHQILFTELKKHIGCKKTLDLLWLFITANNQNKGIPIGASTSQIMANLALNPLDHYAKRELRLKTYLRYCDDMIALFETKDVAHNAYNKLDVKVRQLNLRFNNQSKVYFIDNGIDWVGYRHWRKYKLIRKRTLKKIRRKSINAKLETIMAYLSHSKETNSLIYVINLLWDSNPHYHKNIYDWVKNNTKILNTNKKCLK